MPSGEMDATLDSSGDRQGASEIRFASGSPPSESRDELTGGHYRPGEEIARGGMGSVQEAKDTILQRTVAMKVLRSGTAASADARERFEREASVLARLEYPNIVPIHEMGRDAEGNAFYTMKLVKGQTLQGILKALKDGEVEVVKRYSLDRLLTIFRKVCDAVAFAHHWRIVHRDLKP